MRLQFILFFLFFIGYVCSQSSVSDLTSTSKLPVSFIENSGQIRDQNHKPRADIVYSGQTGNLSYYIKKNGISYQFSKVRSWREIDGPGATKKCKIPDTTVVYRLDATWIKANPQVSWQGEDQLTG